MLTIRYIDRSTGIAAGDATISDAIPIRAMKYWCHVMGWDYEIIGYQPSPA